MTNECNNLKEEIEELKRIGYLSCFKRDLEQGNNNRSLPIDGEIRTIFGGPHIAGDSRNSMDRYAREAKKSPLTSVVLLDQRPIKAFKCENEPIPFTEVDAR